MSAGVDADNHDQWAHEAACLSEAYNVDIAVAHALLDSEQSIEAAVEAIIEGRVPRSDVIPPSGYVVTLDSDCERAVEDISVMCGVCPELAHRAWLAAEGDKSTAVEMLVTGEVAVDRDCDRGPDVTIASGAGAESEHHIDDWQHMSESESDDDHEGQAAQSVQPTESRPRSIANASCGDSTNASCGGRKSRCDLREEATFATCIELVEHWVNNVTCDCFRSAVSSGLSALRGLADSVSQWREDLASVSSRSLSLLHTMNSAFELSSCVHTGYIKASSGRHHRIPRVAANFCVDCWGLAAGVASVDVNGRVHRGRMLGEVIASFNRGELNDHNMNYNYVEQKARSKDGGMSSEDGRVLAWLRMWLPGHTDQSPVDNNKWHLDGPSKKYVHDHMTEDFEHRGWKVMKYNKFLAVLNSNFKIIVHKHKQFAECGVCTLFKQLWAKCKYETEAIRHQIRMLRQAHFTAQYNERMEYYIGREMSHMCPTEHLCMIIDAMTEASTSVPLLARESKGFKLAKFKTALVGALVHGVEGFFGYTCNSLKGARITVEVLHRTLLKLKMTRKVWPRKLLLQLDNTSSDNKNHTVFAYCAWLVATGVFEHVSVRFLMVGHTHEDVDAYFGMFRQYLWKQTAAIMTIDALHGHIRQCFSQQSNAQLVEEAEHLFDEPSMHNFDRVSVEHVYGTYHWTEFLLGVRPNRAFCEVDNITLLGYPDVYRPHVFDFEMHRGAVVLNMKHWAADQEYWNEAPMPVWARIPDLKDLRPCPLEGPYISPGAKPGTEKNARKRDVMREMITEFRRCDVTFTTRRERCGSCQRCVHMNVVREYTQHATVMTSTQADVDWWEQHFTNINADFVLHSLVPLAEMELPRCNRPRELPSAEAQLDALPALMKQAPKELPCLVRAHFAGLGRKQAKRKAGCTQPTAAQTTSGNDKRSNDGGSNKDPGESGKTQGGMIIQRVIGVVRSTVGKLQYAVLCRYGEDLEVEGKWISDANLQAHSLKDGEQGQSLKAQWFGAECPCVLDGMLLFQEDTNKMYEGSLRSYEDYYQSWNVQFHEQQANSVFGTWACLAETQLIDLLTLEVHSSVVDRGTPAKKPMSPVQSKQPISPVHMACQVRTSTQQRAIEMVSLRPCFVELEHFEPLDQEESVKEQCDQRHHRFWVSKAYFGMEFIQQKLGKQLLTVGDRGVDVAQMEQQLVMSNQSGDEPRQTTSEFEAFVSKSAGNVAPGVLHMIQTSAAGGQAQRSKRARRAKFNV
jgi:hypothetical protein